MRFLVKRLFDFYGTKWADARTPDIQYCIDNEEDLILVNQGEEMLIKKEEFIGKTTEDFFRISDRFYTSKFEDCPPYQLYAFEFKPGIFVNKKSKVKVLVEEKKDVTHNLFDPLTDD